jgi:hypothetical protein
MVEVVARHSWQHEVGRAPYGMWDRNLTHRRERRDTRDAKRSPPALKGMPSAQVSLPRIHFHLFSEQPTGGVLKMSFMRRIADGPFRDGMPIDFKELRASVKMSERATLEAIAELERDGFLVNLTPERPIQHAIVRLTCFPFQGQAPTQDYVTKCPVPPESGLRALRRRCGRGRR